MLCKLLTAPSGIKEILISRLKLILFCSLNIFVNSRSAIIRTGMRSLGSFNWYYYSFEIEFNK